MQIKDDIQGMDEIFSTLDKIKPTRLEKATIVEAGAQIAERKLKEAASKVKNQKLDKIVMDFKKSHGGRYELSGHLDNGVTHKYNQYIDGGTDVGFMNGYVTVAHWVNDGTYRQPATNFLDAAGAQMIEDASIREAEAKAAEIIMKRKGLI